MGYEESEKPTDQKSRQSAELREANTIEVMQAPFLEACRVQKSIHCEFLRIRIFRLPHFFNVRD